MALTAAVRYSNRAGNGLAGQTSYKVKGLVRIYHGALVGVDPNSGYVQNWTSGSAALLRFRGLAMPLSDSVLGDTTGATLPTPECPVNESGLILEGVTVTGAVQSSVGKAVYASDENTLTMTATSNVGSIGEVTRFVSSGVADVRLFTPQEYLALESLGKV
jgi:hypothetical protein